MGYELAAHPFVSIVHTKLVFVPQVTEVGAIDSLTVFIPQLGPAPAAVE